MTKVRKDFMMKNPGNLTKRAIIELLTSVGCKKEFERIKKDSGAEIPLFYYY